MKRLAGMLLPLFALACAPAPERPVPAAAPPDLHEARYRAAAAAGRAVYRIDREHSVAWVVVRRGGPLARLGHDHVVASHALEGRVLWPAPAKDGRADVRVDLRALVVDEPALRRRLGLGEPLDSEAVAGTASNMHEKVLESARHPYLGLRLRQVSAAAMAGGRVEGRLTLHGVTRPVVLEVQAHREEDVLRLSGRFGIRQTGFGITPFSILGGALRVQDSLEGGFEITAHRWRG